MSNSEAVKYKINKDIFSRLSPNQMLGSDWWKVTTLGT